MLFFVFQNYTVCKVELIFLAIISVSARETNRCKNARALKEPVGYGVNAPKQPLSIFRSFSSVALLDKVSVAPSSHPTNVSLLKIRVQVCSSSSDWPCTRYGVVWAAAIVIHESFAFLRCSVNGKKGHQQPQSLRFSAKRKLRENSALDPTRHRGDGCRRTCINAILDMIFPSWKVV